jgi:hypothetical protein
MVSSGERKGKLDTPSSRLCPNDGSLLSLLGVTDFARFDFDLGESLFNALEPVRLLLLGYFQSRYSDVFKRRDEAAYL